ncbi:uncharacterized protein BDR25DRAFT_318374 [Lindgomyces ingoldianus]|uniref:Uncharacterized protein n=1 Tax=Lindgomyces ingoldianus TaxID=673940 RepID=A0ACB6QEX9_9PLEO|nr:uncharacterized protein BDR25DRAFT_318374 [Lindgomyces ingoldianus]KAF2465513.1 hypothetical protein BDR25DRAFT_318374 [Lindgomyces ingoldianus]
MYHFTAPQIYQPPTVSSGTHLRSHDVTLTLRQQPKEALVTTEGKEKVPTIARKPVDPPPIIQLTVKPQADPAQHFLQSPYLFMCTSLYKVDKDEAWDGNAGKSLAGSLVSSLHRLKDVDNKDGGFFVFGDISVKVQGTFRLNFSLFDLRKDSHDVMYLGSITSEPFRVLLPKDFKGMDESTYLSRAFSDQGVRLRLRKEPRAMMGNKRPYPYGVDSATPNTPIRPSLQEYSPYGDDSQSPVKRFRADTEDRKEQYPDHSGAAYPSSYPSSQYPVRQSSLTGLHSMAGYPTFGSLTTGTSSPYQFRTSIGAASSYLSDPLLQTSGPSTMTSHQRYPEMQQPQYSQMFSSYAQQRVPTTSAMSFPDDTTGLGRYQTASTVGMGDEHRPSTATGVAPAIAMAQQTPQSQHSSHPSHDSIGSSRGASFTHSPEMIRTTGFPDRLQLGSQLPTPHRQLGRYDDQAQMTSGLYSNQRNNFQAPPTESSLTSLTDTGVVQHTLHYNPGLSQSTEEHGADSH